MRHIAVPAQTKNCRHIIVWGLLFLVALSVVWRLSQLHLVKDKFLQTQGDYRARRTIPIPSYRGIIFDRNGEALAISSPVPSAWVDPSAFEMDTPHWPVLAKLLDLNQSTLDKIQAQKNKTFLYLKRHIPPTLAKQVLDLGIKGIHIQKEYRRYYPTAEVTAHVVGSAGVDHTGIEGLELALNDKLSGHAGQKTVLKDRLGAHIEHISHNRNATQGQDVTLSLDSRIQYLAYTELLKTVKKHKAKSGTIVVLNAKTS